MKPYGLRFWIFNGSIMFWLLASQPTAAEIIPDTTLPVNSTVTLQNNTRVIEGGTPRDDNLFHSFQEFSLSTGAAFFNNDLAVRNILTRVTGGSRSDIDGTIKANGTANLFLINPNGIFFGQNASLQIGGSFVASTANSLKFADGTEFSATAPQAAPLLTVKVPSGLQFGSNVEEIVNQSQASPNGLVNFVKFPVGLHVQSSRTLALVGGNVSLENGNLTAAGGRIELGSVAGPGLVNLSNLSAIKTGYALGYTDIQNFGDIQLSRVSLVDVSGEGGGAIQIQGRNITLAESSQIISTNTGSASGETLAVNAAESVSLRDGAFISTFAGGQGRAGDVIVRSLDSVKLIGSQFPTGIGSQVFPDATGNGGNLTIETGRLLVQDGASVDASTFGMGQAGNVLMRALNSVELVGTTPDGRQGSGIFAQVAEEAIADAGDAGSLTIETGRLTILDGAQVSVAGRRRGNAGTLNIKASDSIQLSGASPTATLTVGRSGIFASAEPGATLEAGKLNITTRQLTVENGAEISANNFGSGRGGTATLKVEQLIIQDGGEVRANSFGEGPGGTLTVKDAESVQIMGTGTIGSNRIPVTSALSVSSEGSGKAGDLQVQARSVQLDNSGSISADTSGGGGNIELRSPSLILRRGSSITTNATGSEISGGNITLNTDVLAALENSDIRADSAEFKGGTVRINAQGIFGTEFRDALTPESDITATGANSELIGTVEINTPDVDPSRGLVQLPDAPVNVEVAQGCQAGQNQSSVAFFNIGRGGLAPNPYEPLSSSNIWEDVTSSIPKTENPDSENNPSASPDKIVEAKGWIFNEKGEVTLLAEMPSTRSQVGCRLN